MDDIWHVWNDLQRKEDDLKWGGHPSGFGAQYDSMGRPAGSHCDGGGGWMHEQMGRVERVRRALQDSGAPAQSMIGHTLSGIELSPVWPILMSACQDIALCYGSAAKNGGFIGGAGGRFFGGVGAASGASAGGQMQGGWVTALLGVPSLAEGLSQAILEAGHHYETGFLEAWGPTRQGNGYGCASNARGDPAIAAFHFAHGHMVMVVAILAALVAYLAKNKDGKAALLSEISHSPRLGATMAAWAEKNEAALSRHSALRSRRWTAATDEESSSAVRRQPVVADAVGKASGSSLDEQFDGNPPSEQELAEMDRKSAAGMADVLAHGERFASTEKDPRSWATIAHGGQLSPNPGGADYPAGVLDKGEDYTKQTYTEGNRSFPVVQTAKGVYSYPSANGQPAMEQVIVSGKAARAALLAADAAAQNANLAEINADLRHYTAQQAADAMQANGGWADSRQPESPVIDFRQKVASNAAVVNNLLSKDGWSAVGSVLKDAIRNSGGINGPGFDVRSGPVISATAKEQDAAVDTLLSVPAFFEHELAFSSVVAPVSVGGASGAASINPGRFAAESQEVSLPSIMRSLRQAGTPESLATGKLLSREKITLNMIQSDPTGRGLGGLFDFGSMEVKIYLDASQNAAEAAGYTAHEATHFMQGLTSKNYNLGHEFDAFRVQGAVDPLHWSNGMGDNALYQYLRIEPVYSRVPSVPVWPRP